MNKTYIKQTARNFGAVSFKTVAGGKSKWLVCYTSSIKDRDGLLRGLLDSGFAADTGHFGNQVDVKVA